MQNPILVLNCGSSSIKYALLSNDNSERVAGLAENLGLDTARIKHTDLNGEKVEISLAGANHQWALQKILGLLAAYKPVAVGHRVVHGGREFSHAEKVNDHVLAEVKRLKVLAPLHNPAHALGIEAVEKIYPNLPQVVVFDTAFHQTMPAKAYRYAIPKDFYNEHYIRRYGFHGSSHAYVSHRADSLAPHHQANGWITVHLGNGCSLTAVYDGKSLDTSMGLTPLEGVVMGTRSGDVDPSLHIHLHRILGYSLDQIDTILNKHSGLLGISGISSDMRTVEQAANEGNEDAKLAIEIFCYKAARYIASLSCALPIFTGLVFTGGIGENSASIRQKILQNLPHFGIKANLDKNAELSRGVEGSFHQADSQLQLWVIPTDEEYQIAKETKEVLGL
ncbi:acetate kinase [Moraxella sp. CTOTU49803]|uniref:acetate/propionate family kinase n=1 Tax=Moraxella sp. CTOTU49803 TaxID=2953840 RepID=UPI0028B2491D|nr:acetate kinase [Moraxella sp. CTOTU49803]